MTQGNLSEQDVRAIRERLEAAKSESAAAGLALEEAEAVLELESSGG